MEWNHDSGGEDSGMNDGDGGDDDVDGDNGMMVMRMEWWGWWNDGGDGEGDRMMTEMIMNTGEDSGMVMVIGWWITFMKVIYHLLLSTS